MGLFNDIRTSLQAFAESGNIPAGGKIFKLKTTEFADEQSDRYVDIQKLLNDERIYSVVALLASLVQNSYGGIHLKPKNRYTDDELDTTEQKILTAADDFADELNGLDFKQLFFDIAWNIILHGEERFLYILDKNEDGKIDISELRSVDLSSSYFVDNKSQVKDKDVTVFSDKILVVKKEDDDNNPDTFEREDFEHLSYHRRSIWKRDIEGRNTFGVYSIAPAKCLQNLRKWKLKTMENDVAWKNKLMPRILHILKMAGISAARYPGATPQAKTKAALNDAKQVINDFKNSTKIDTPDQDLIVSDSVETKILEANSTNYQRPNETLDQINSAFSTPFGIPDGQMGGKSGASMGSELDSIFESIRVDTISSLIAKHLGKAIRKHMILTQNGANIDVIKRLFIHVDTTLPVHKHTLARALLALAKSGTVTKAEMRTMMKFPRIPQLPKEAFPDAGRIDLRDSDAQQEKDLLSETSAKNTNNETPGAKKNTGESQRE